MADMAPERVGSLSNHPDDTGMRFRNRHGSIVEAKAQDGTMRTLNLDELTEADAQLAIQFGYKPVFKREFGYLSTFSFAVSISGLFATIMTTFSYPLYAGGSAAAIWDWLISGAGCMCIALSVAELVSAYPTSGGLYVFPRLYTSPTQTTSRDTSCVGYWTITTL